MITQVDEQGRTWHLLERDGGSISLYYTLHGDSLHYVVWDSLDAPKIEALEGEVARLTYDLEQAQEALERATTSLGYWHKQATTK